MIALRDSIPAAYRSGIRFDEPLARHTTWHVGGPADAYYTPSSAEELAQFLADLPRDVRARSGLLPQVCSGDSEPATGG